MRRVGLFGLEAVGAIILGGFLVLLVLNAIVALGVVPCALLVLLFFAALGIYTFYGHYFGAP
jgi:hypothetical protein